MPPCRLRRRKFWTSDYEMVHSEVYLNKYVVSKRLLYTWLPWLLSKCSENCSFCMFSLFLHFPGGQLTQFARFRTSMDVVEKNMDLSSVESLVSSSKKSTRRRENGGVVVDKNLKSQRTFNRNSSDLLARYSNDPHRNSGSIFLI